MMNRLVVFELFKSVDGCLGTLIDNRAGHVRGGRFARILRVHNFAHLNSVRCLGGLCSDANFAFVVHFVEPIVELVQFGLLVGDEFVYFGHSFRVCVEFLRELDAHFFEQVHLFGRFGFFDRLVGRLTIVFEQY